MVGFGLNLKITTVYWCAKFPFCWNMSSLKIKCHWFRNLKAPTWCLKLRFSSSESRYTFVFLFFMSLCVFVLSDVCSCFQWELNFRSKKIFCSNKEFHEYISVLFILIFTGTFFWQAELFIHSVSSLGNAQGFY